MVLLNEGSFKIYKADIYFLQKIYISKKEIIFRDFSIKCLTYRNLYDIILNCLMFACPYYYISKKKGQETRKTSIFRHGMWAHSCATGGVAKAKLYETE